MTDGFDPNTWPAPEPYRRVYLDASAELFAIVDEEDYAWAVQWLWSATPNSTKRKFYATRSTRLQGVAGPQVRIYLHKAILERTGLTPPSKKHSIGDHENGDSLDCRRDNLRWATHSMNSFNVNGVYARQRAMAV